MVIEQNHPHPYVLLGDRAFDSGWRAAFARGFLDGDAGRDPAEGGWGYRAGLNAGRLLAWMRVRGG